MFLAKFRRHHSSSLPGGKALVHSEEAALEAALEHGWQAVVRGESGPVQRAARMAGAPGLAFRAFDEGYDDAGDDEEYVVWDFVDHDGSLAGSPVQRPWGVARGASVAGVDKREAVWIELEEWVPDAKRTAELGQCDKAELIRMILEMEAVR